MNAGVCLFEWDEGEPCEDEDESVSDLYFYYDAERGQCNTTLAYNCEGNGNRFQNGFDCLDTCDPSSEWREGSCMFIHGLLH